MAQGVLEPNIGNAVVQVRAEAGWLPLHHSGTAARRHLKSPDSCSGFSARASLFQRGTSLQ
jgi:hypothetical protein